jgi:hypothetical protein
VVVGPFVRSVQLGDVPGIDLVWPGGRQFGRGEPADESGATSASVDVTRVLARAATPSPTERAASA